MFRDSEASRIIPGVLDPQAGREPLDCVFELFWVVQMARWLPRESKLWLIRVSYG